MCSIEIVVISFDWPEPFGLVMTEAMAYGTPVIAFRHGCSSGSQNAARIKWLDRHQARQSFDRRFTARQIDK
jgi:hypothetical protein